MIHYGFADYRRIIFHLVLSVIRLIGLIYRCVAKSNQRAVLILSFNPLAIESTLHFLDRETSLEMGLAGANFCTPLQQFRADGLQGPRIARVRSASMGCSKCIICILTVSVGSCKASSAQIACPIRP